MSAYVIFDVEIRDMTGYQAFYSGPVYQGLKSIRDQCSSARLVAVEGIEP